MTIFHHYFSDYVLTGDYFMVKQNSTFRCQLMWISRTATC